MIRRRVLLGALLGALFALGWWVGGGRAASGLYSGLDLFVEVLQAVQTNYVDAVDTGKLMAGAMRGVAHGLDPWSRYLDPDEAKAARAAAPGAFDGIGAAVDVRGGWPVMIAPVEGSPAWDAPANAGLREMEWRNVRLYPSSVWSQKTESRVPRGHTPCP